MAEVTHPRVLVVGATGKQGGAVVSALLSPRNKQKYPGLQVLAMTRNATSAGALALAARHEGALVLVQGDISTPAAVFTRDRGPIAAVFVVTVPGRGSEDAVAIPFIDAAVAHGVRHVVFSSVDRGGEPRSWENPTAIKHFYDKHAVELHLRQVGRKKGGTTTYTVLRPVAFMDNMNPGTSCSVFTSLWSQALAPDTRLQLVGCRDIGRFAARALLDPEDPAHRNVAVGLAGDELTLAEAKDVFKRAVGRDVPQAWGIVGKAVLWAVAEVRSMFYWFESEGYGVDIAAVRKADHDVMGLERWLREESGWKNEVQA